MSSMTRFIPALVLGIGALLVSGVREQFTVPTAKPIATLPASVLDRTARDIIVDKEEQRIAGMSYYVMRSFANPDSTEAFQYYVGYYERQVQGKTIHSPKNCLPGAGWEILQSSSVSLPGSSRNGTANRVILSSKSGRAMVYYWYQGRGREESNEYRVKWNLLHDAALYGRTEEALVRVVVPIARSETPAVGLDRDANVMQADSVARAVAQLLTPAVSKIMPSAPGA